MKELPLLGGIAAFLRWTEELVFLLSGPGLTVAAGIAVTSLLTHGALLNGHSWILSTWALLTAVGCESQLVGTFDKLRHAVIHRHGWQIVGWLLLGLALGYITFVSVMVFGFSQSQGLNEAQSLARLGISAAAWQWQRSLLSVGLVALAGFNRYRPEVKTLQDEKAELRRELELTPIRQRLAEMKAVGAVQTFQSVRRVVTGKEPTPPRPPTGPGSPATTPVDPHAEAVVQRPAVLRPVQPDAKQKVARAKMTLKHRAFRLLDDDANWTVAEMARRLRCSKTHAQRLRAEWFAEHGQMEGQRAN